MYGFLSTQGNPCSMWHCFSLQNILESATENTPVRGLDGHHPLNPVLQQTKWMCKAKWHYCMSVGPYILITRCPRGFIFPQFYVPRALHSQHHISPKPYIPRTPLYACRALHSQHSIHPGHYKYRIQLYVPRVLHSYHLVSPGPYVSCVLLYAPRALHS